MAFSLYKHPPQLTDFLSQFPGDFRHPITSTSDAKPRFTEFPFIDHSRVPKRKRLSLHQELVNAAKSFSLYLQPSDNDSIPTSSLIDYSAMPISFMPPQDPPKKTTYPTCEDTLKLKEPAVQKKKRTKKVKCGQVVSSHANEQSFQIVCWDASATQVKEPSKKKRKTPPKIESGPVVKNEVTEQLQKFIMSDEMNGSELKLVIQKVLYKSDLKQDQNRLSLPFKKMETEDFLTTKERLELENKEEIEVRVVGPTLEMYKEPMRMAIWDMKNTHNLVLRTNWYHFVKENKEYLKELSKIQVWSFRKNQQLCFALAVVGRPPDGINSTVAIYSDFV